MRKVLVEGANDRGGVVRISTRQDSLTLDVYYLDTDKQIRKVEVTFEPDKHNNVIIGCCGDTYAYYGVLADALSAKV